MCVWGLCSFDGGVHYIFVRIQNFVVLVCVAPHFFYQLNHLFTNINRKLWLTKEIYLTKLASECLMDELI